MVEEPPVAIELERESFEKATGRTLDRIFCIHFSSKESGRGAQFIKDDPKVIKDMIDARRKSLANNGNIPEHMRWDILFSVVLDKPLHIDFVCGLVILYSKLKGDKIPELERGIVNELMDKFEAHYGAEAYKKMKEIDVDVAELLGKYDQERQV